MTHLTARDALKVIVDGEEVPGLIVYGLRGHKQGTPARFPGQVWDVGRDPLAYILHGEHWEVPMWEIPIVSWRAPSDLQSALKSTLAELLNAGCLVAWVGAEGLPFCDPPQLFDPECMSGGVLAWMTDEASELWIDLDEPVAPVPDNVMVELRRRATGLADAT